MWRPGWMLVGDTILFGVWAGAENRKCGMNGKVTGLTTSMIALLHLNSLWYLLFFPPLWEDKLLLTHSCCHRVILLVRTIDKVFVFTLRKPFSEMASCASYMHPELRDKPPWKDTVLTQWPDWLGGRLNIDPKISWSYLLITDDP